MGGAFARNMHVKINESEITIEVSMSYLALSVPRTEPLLLYSIAIKYYVNIIDN